MEMPLVGQDQSQRRTAQDGRIELVERGGNLRAVAVAAGDASVALKAFLAALCVVLWVVFLAIVEAAIRAARRRAARAQEIRQSLMLPDVAVDLEGGIVDGQEERASEESCIGVQPAASPCETPDRQLCIAEPDVEAAVCCDVKSGTPEVHGEPLPVRRSLVLQLPTPQGRRAHSRAVASSGHHGNAAEESLGTPPRGLDEAGTHPGKILSFMGSCHSVPGIVVHPPSELMEKPRKLVEKSPDLSRTTSRSPFLGPRSARTLPSRIFPASQEQGKPRWR
mmetsp:Transcript_62118/g.134867  ORF Transcript_62118/g.134867 Transcript_62118/m.134867 type:complete len:279 (+) Transcript_62118:54-890(+)